MRKKKFAFIVHARTDLAADLAGGGLGAIARSTYATQLLERTLPRVRLPPLVWSEVRLQDQPLEPAGFILMVPLGAQHMLSLPRHEVVFRIEQAIEKSISLGAEVIGLGALTSPLTGGGKQIAHRRNVAITNGNAFTAAMMFAAIQRVVEATGKHIELSIIGATGSVGSCVAQLIAKHGLVERLNLVARQSPPLVELATSLHSQQPSLHIKTSSHISDARHSEIVVLLTASADSLLKAEHLKLGAYVIDGTQPRNTDASVLHHRPDITMIDGGWVAVPGIQFTHDLIDWPRGCSFACLAETILLGLEGIEEHFCIGQATVAQAEYMLSLAQKYRRYGFSLAPFYSFGKPLPLDWQRECLPSSPTESQASQ